MNFNKGINIAQIALLGLSAFWAVRAAIAFFAPQSAWTVFEARPAIEVPNIAQTSAPQNSLGQKINVSFDPFHRETAAAQEPSLGEDAPETTLDLKLVGRRSGADGTAILVTPDGKQKIYRIEDEILRGVSLKAVNVDYVVISQEGRLERLTFIKPKDSGLRAPNVEFEPVQAQEGGSGSSLTVKVKPSTSLRGNRAAPRPDQNQNAFAQSGSIQNTPVQNAPVLNSANTNAPAAPNLTNPAAVLGAVNFTPFRKNNRLIGFRVSPKQAGFDLDSFGLQNGDVITSIDGKSLQSESLNLGSVLVGLRGRKNATVDLLRNGGPISLTIGAP